MKENGGLYHAISIDFIHVGDDATALIKVGKEEIKTLLKAGFNKVEMNLPKVEAQANFFAEVKIKHIILALIVIIAAGWAVTLARALAA